MAQRDPKRKSLSVRLDGDLVERARTLARDLAGRPTYLTLSRLVEEGLAERVRYYQGLVDDEPSDPIRPSRNSTHRR